MTLQLIEELKENNQDFEFYPTTREMIATIWMQIRENTSSILDIGCGTCNFKKYLLECENEYKAREDRKEKEAEAKGDRYYRNDKRFAFDYYVMEKSKILLDRLDKDVIVLGTDFNLNQLIDKKVDAIFCNPPYSEYEKWTKRIITEGNCNKIFLVIPQRWKENKDINAVIKATGAKVKILGSFDFLTAERAARAKVDILYINKSELIYGREKELGDINNAAFDQWFDETFEMRDSSKENEYERDAEEAKKQTIKNQLVGSESKAKMLVDLYGNEQKNLYEHFKYISKLDTRILERFGVNKESVKSALRQEIKSLKILYWKIVFDEMEEITSRLTSQTRDKMMNRFKNLLTVDFTVENIYPLILWVIKNANGYYNEQLIDFFKDLSDEENVKFYKSNQKTFQKDGWRYNFAEKHSHYTLDYRIICSRWTFGIETSYNGNEIETRYNYNKKIGDIKVIFNNLGFKINYVEEPKDFGKKYYAYSENDQIMFEFKVYKNGNMHVKLNIEFTKAMNVEVSRLLGWIRNKEDIKKEFCAEMAKAVCQSNPISIPACIEARM